MTADDNLSEVQMNYSRHKLTHRITATTPTGEEAGHLHWGRTEHVGYTGDTISPHEISEVSVEEPYRRQKLATHMWQMAQAVDPDIAHSGNKTMLGGQWAKSVGGNDPWSE